MQSLTAAEEVPEPGELSTRRGAATAQWSRHALVILSAWDLVNLSALEQLQQGTGSPAFLLSGFSPDGEEPAGEPGFTNGPLCPLMVVGPIVLLSLCYSCFHHDLCLSWVYKVF